MSAPARARWDKGARPSLGLAWPRHSGHGRDPPAPAGISPPGPGSMWLALSRPAPTLVQPATARVSAYGAGGCRTTVPRSPSPSRHRGSADRHRRQPLPGPPAPRVLPPHLWSGRGPAAVPGDGGAGIPGPGRPHRRLPSRHRRWCLPAALGGGGGHGLCAGGQRGHVPAHPCPDAGGVAPGQGGGGCGCPVLPLASPPRVCVPHTRHGATTPPATCWPALGVRGGSMPVPLPAPWA